MAMSLFTGGYLPLDQRSMLENLYFAICHKIQAAREEAGIHARGIGRARLVRFRTRISATFRCSNRFPTVGRSSSCFRSCRFTGSNERPTRNAVIGDITCDSDGKIDQFIDRRDVKRTLPLHPYVGKPYYLAAFLIGAYQEILGDLHNLYGDTNAVHVSLDDKGEVCWKR